MRRWIVLLLAGLMVFGLFGCGTKDGEDSATGDSAGQPEESTPTTTEADTNTDPDPSDPTDDLKQYEHTVVLNSGTEGIKILGERSLESSTQLNCDWTCSGLEFVIDCKGGNLTLRTSTTDPCYFRVWVDGEAWENTDGSLYYMINGTKNLVVPDMPVGEHTVRVLKVTGYTLARAHFYSMTFYGSLLADKATASAADGASSATMRALIPIRTARRPTPIWWRRRWKPIMRSLHFRGRGCSWATPA